MHMIVVALLSISWRHNYLTKMRLAGCTDKQSMYSLMSMVCLHVKPIFELCFITKLLLIIKINMPNAKSDPENGRVNEPSQFRKHTPRDQCYNLLKLQFSIVCNRLEVFVLGRSFKPDQIFVGKARSLLKS